MASVLKAVCSNLGALTSATSLAQETSGNEVKAQTIRFRVDGKECHQPGVLIYLSLTCPGQLPRGHGGGPPTSTEATYISSSGHTGTSKRVVVMK